MSDIRDIADQLYESNDEYISKRDAYLAVNAVVTGCESKDIMEALATVLVNLYQVPIAYVASVVKAHYKKRYLEESERYDLECSNCGFRIVLDYYDIQYARYCNSCGAKWENEETS